MPASQILSAGLAGKLRVLDVEFLLKPVWDLKKPLLYLYREGSLKGELRSILERSLVSHGKFLHSADLGTLSFGGGLFSSVPFCDLGEDANERRIQDVRSNLSQLIGIVDGLAVLFAPHKSSHLSRVEREVIEAHFTFVEEQFVDEQTMSPVLTYLVSTTQLISGIKKIEDSFPYFLQFISSSTNVTFLQMRGEFERAALLYWDDERGCFSRFRLDEAAAERALVAGPLARIILKREASAVAALLVGLERKCPTSDATKLWSEVLRQTVLLMRKIGQKPELPNSDVLGVAIWAGLLLAQMAHIENEESGSLVAVNRLMFDYLARRNIEVGQSPLSGLWFALNSIQSEIVEEQVFRKALVLLLSKHLVSSPRWVRRLHGALTESVQTIIWDPIETDASSPDHEWDPATFSDILGNQMVVSALRERCVKRRYRRPIILVGNEGAGKRTLARVYGRAMFCEAMTADSEACGSCQSCQFFEEGFDVYEIDAMGDSGTSYLRENIIGKATSSLSGRRIVIVHNADKNANLIEILLKTLERGLESTLMIFLVSDIGGISLAGQSRCEVFNLLPLSRAEMEELANRFLSRMDIFDPEICALLTDICAGLPGNIARLCGELKKAGVRTSDAVVRALNLDWGSPLIGAFQKLISGASLDEGNSLSRESKVLNSSEKFKTVLYEIYRVSCGDQLHEPALRFCSQDFQALLASLKRRAFDLNIDFFVLWRKLSDCWNENDGADRLSAGESMLAMRSILRVNE